MPSEPHDHRLRRMRLRASRRGIREMDLILGRFAADRLETLPSDALDLFDALLWENDQDLYLWVSGQADPPGRFAALIADISAHAAP